MRSKEGIIPQAPSHYGGAESLPRALNYCGWRQKVPTILYVHSKILQYCKFASERSQVQTWGHQTCFLPRVPSKLVTPLGTREFNLSHMPNLLDTKESNKSCAHVLFGVRQSPAE